MLEAGGVNLDQIEEFRQDMHQNCEGSMEEYRTQEKIMERLDTLGLSPKPCGGTGVVCDISGTADLEHDEHGVKMVALRCDLDGLKMEESADVLFKSQTQYAHMCGHDGHTAILLATTEYLANNRNRIPKNKTVRCIFQPGEEKLLGAKAMIADGVLEGVDEIYGFHNFPLGSEGQILVRPREMMAGSTDVDIKVIGKGGHGSEPAGSIDPVTAMCFIHTGLHAIKSRKIMNKEKFSLVFGKFQAGSS